jgi:aminoglycoside phosphotransferase (APT) family kinase protein
MPQVFVDGVRLCDEDTDLGMDFALSRLLEGKVAAPAAPAAKKEEGK